MTMAEKVLPFSIPGPASARPVIAQHCRTIFQIGGKCFVFDFQSSVTETNPANSSVLSICESVPDRTGARQPADLRCGAGDGAIGQGS